jgi:UDP-glucose 4-epimerase
MKVLVTGAAGFLGRHVARHFRDSGWDVSGFDVSWFEEPGITFIQGDLTEANSITQAALDTDVIAHIGAIGDVYLAGEQPALAAEVNVVGTANVVEAALKAEARVVYASTWEVYGEPVSEPITEEHPTMPDHPYSITKLAGESLVLAAARLRDLPALALRLGTAYGSGLRSNSVFRIFLDKARSGDPIVIQGDGSQGRQFTHAADIARAFRLAATSRLHGHGVKRGRPRNSDHKGAGRGHRRPTSHRGELRPTAVGRCAARTRVSREGPCHLGLDHRGAIRDRSRRAHLQCRHPTQLIGRGSSFSSRAWGWAERKNSSPSLPGCGIAHASSIESPTCSPGRTSLFPRWKQLAPK